MQKYFLHSANPFIETDKRRFLSTIEPELINNGRHHTIIKREVKHDGTKRSASIFVTHAKSNSIQERCDYRKIDRTNA